MCMLTHQKVTVFYSEKKGLWEGRVTYGGLQRSFYGKTKDDCMRKVLAFLKQVKKGKCRVLSEDEINALYEALFAKTDEGSLKNRDGGILVLMLVTGLRVGEVLDLKWEDINEAYLHIHEGVMKLRERSVLLNDTARACLKALMDYDSAHGIDSEYVACTRMGRKCCAGYLAKGLEKIERSAGLSLHITPQMLRHTFGMTLLQGDMNGDNV